MLSLVHVSSGPAGDLIADFRVDHDRWVARKVPLPSAATPAQVASALRELASAVEGLTDESEDQR